MMDECFKCLIDEQKGKLSGHPKPMESKPSSGPVISAVMRPWAILRGSEEPLLQRTALQDAHRDSMSFFPWEYFTRKLTLPCCQF